MKDLNKYDIKERLDSIEKQYVTFFILNVMAESNFTVSNIDYDRDNTVLKFTQAQLFVFNGKFNGNTFRIYLDKLNEEDKVVYDFVVYSYDKKFERLMEEWGSLFHYKVPESDWTLCKVEHIIDTLFEMLKSYN